MNQYNISFERVIEGLECCGKYPNEFGDCLGGDCPYVPHIDCHKELMQDALALLKAQEPVKPTLRGKEPYNYFTCGNCDNPINIKAKYCWNCGRAVKWGWHGSRSLKR